MGRTHPTKVLLLVLVGVTMSVGGCYSGEDDAGYCQENPYAEPCGGVQDTGGNGVDDSVDEDYGRDPDGSPW